MNRRTNALTTVATTVMLGAVTLAQQPQVPGAGGQTVAMNDMMKQCIEHCRTAPGQAVNQADDKQSMGCMAMMGMQKMQDMPDMKNMSEMKDMPAMQDMAGMSSKAQQDGSAPAATQQTPRMATSLRELERVCGQKLDPRTAPKSTYNGKTYYFCSPEDKTRFDQNPAQSVGERMRAPREDGRQTKRRGC